MGIHACLQGACLGQSRYACLLIPVAYLPDNSQDQCCAQTLYHSTDRYLQSAVEG
jgi:hypothetical protein